MMARIRWPIAATLLALAGCSLATTSSMGSRIGSSAVPGGETAAAVGGGNLIVPNLIGKTPMEAAAIVKAAGFTQDIESSRPVECEDAPEVEGRINCQDPEPGKFVATYTMIQINVYKTQHIAGAIVRAQLLALIGMTPDQAKAALQSYGHDASLTVMPGSHFYDNCGENRVCEFDVAESGIGIHDPITLFINPGVTISAPPPP